MDERLGELDALAHALREAADGASAASVELDGRERALGRGRARVGARRAAARTAATTSRAVRNGHSPSPSGTMPTRRNTSGSRRGSCPSTRTVPVLGVGEAGAELERRRLAGAVVAEQARSRRATARTTPRRPRPCRRTTSRRRRTRASASGPPVAPAQTAGARSPSRAARGPPGPAASALPGRRVARREELRAATIGSAAEQEQRSWRSAPTPNDEHAGDGVGMQHQRRVAADRERPAARERGDRQAEQAK